MNLPSRPRWWTLLWLCLLAASTNLRAEPLFRPNDIIAFVGGEDMVAAAEHGELELVITAALPDYKLKFRSLAWEGDTVYEQHRDVNYPALEQQLEKIGATVVICWFGTMESFEGPERVPQFIEAYRGLLGRLGADWRRTLVLVPPSFGNLESTEMRHENLRSYQSEIRSMTRIQHGSVPALRLVDISDLDSSKTGLHRDGVHLNHAGHASLALTFARKEDLAIGSHNKRSNEEIARLRQTIIEKNRLWFHYYRPQNWAFLAGDRTNQPSSRDHRDPSKRWFPEELEQFLPLIEQKEQQIHELAKEVSK